jgi:DNA polymerase I
VTLEIIRTPVTLDLLGERLQRTPLISFDTETTGLDAWRCKIFMLSFAVGDQSWVVPTKLFKDDHIADFLKKIFHEPSKEVVGANIKFDLHHMKQSFDVECARRLHDVQLQAFLLDENRVLKLKELMRAEIGWDTKEEEAVHEWLKQNCGKRENWRFDQVPEDIMAPYSGADAVGTLRLHEHQYPKIRSHFQTLYDTECAVLKILYKMEENGLRLDRPYLEGIKAQYEKLASLQLRSVWQEAGKEFNVESPKELGQILFGRLKIVPVLRTGKGAPSTNEEALSFIDHPIVEKLQAYRGTLHDLSTYVDGPLEKLDPAGYVHGDYRLTSAKTGRFSCSNPNLQNIKKDPVIRRAYRPELGHEAWLFDMSQIEMVGFAHYSQDAAMVKALREGTDLHTMTAASVYRKGLSEVTKQERAVGKGCNFSIIYGCGADKLSAFFKNYGAEVTKDEAVQLRTRYKQTFPTVDQFSRKVMWTVKNPRPFWEGGPSGHYVKNQFGRIRRIDPQLKAYTGVNHLIQGWAADLMKAGMVRVEKMAPMWKQNIHDAIRVDMPLAWSESQRFEFAREIVHNLSDFPQVSVPIRVTAERFITNWSEVQDVDLTRPHRAAA